MEFHGRRIRLDKVINGLDRFVYGFVRILERHTGYVIVSGYVSILFGRARGTEDVDIFIPVLGKEKLKALYDDLQRHGYWCLNTEDPSQIYEYLEEGLAVRFAKRNQTIPNFEVKFAKKELAKEAFKDAIGVETELGALRVSSLERQIAFKRYYLKSDKDLEDARHIEELFKDRIDNKKVERYRRLIENA